MRPANNPLRASRLACHATNHQTGVGLIEILVAAAILSIGILGIVVLQVKTIADNNSALTRTQASIAAYSMFDIMRSDRANALNGAYDGTVTVGNCPNKTDTLANTQLRNWCQGFDGTNAPPATDRGGLAAIGPATSGTIACNPTGAGITASNCSITITFNDRKATGGQAAQSLTYWTQL